MRNYKFVYLLELEFPTDKADADIIEPICDLAASFGAKIKVVDEFYHERKAKS